MIENRKIAILDPQFSVFVSKWWVATVLPRALRFKRPLHHCNACNPEWLVEPKLGERRLESRAGIAPAFAALQAAA
jgi:hypothetical protein